MGSLNIVAADTDGHTLFWYENDGRGNFKTPIFSTITPNNGSSTMPSAILTEMAHIAV